MQDPPIWLLFLAFPLFWIGLSWMLAQLLGWAKLARIYVAYHRPEGERYHARTIEFGPMASYNNAVTVTLSSEGIHLAMSPIFSVGHSPMILPWSQVTSIQENTLFKSIRGVQVLIECEGKRIKLSLPPQAKPTLDRYTSGRYPKSMKIAGSETTESVKLRNSG